ncbi:hypothetical protein HYH03_011476 [Edaphochlamys debaryana]|uniref:P/Homo B domain-containing protein n=1 Tax=Edaphochlamys debaryana TaxID=47281 RepID=A0A835XX62_9CHLO|nr:hypothetical protein HYH03_011476 [Edaphochlamys debaryana]|eukprot:KAG2490011.1 hypothetical protein HYH03_011476 [Edaphochlamys debaryana]
MAGANCPFPHRRAVAGCSLDFYAPSPIPDESGIECFQTLTGCLISRLTYLVLRTDLVHDFMGDLTITLISPSGVSVDIVSNEGAGLRLDGVYVFSDNATALITRVSGEGTLQPGLYRPEGSMAKLYGMNPAGLWTVRFMDGGAGDVGTVRALQLMFVGTVWPAPPAGACGASYGGSVVTLADVGSAALPAIVEGCPWTRITKVVVRVDLMHSYMGDLQIMLRGPDGTVTDVSSNNGGSKDLSGVYEFDDAAAKSIADSSTYTALPIKESGASVLPPGAYRPEASFAAFCGKAPNGQWSLRFKDDVDGGTGATATLRGFQVILYGTNPWPPLAPGECGATFTGCTAGGHDDGSGGGCITTANMAHCPFTSITEVRLQLRVDSYREGDVYLGLRGSLSHVLNLTWGPEAFGRAHTVTLDGEYEISDLATKELEGDEGLFDPGPRDMLPGSYKPYNLLSSLYGMAPEGTWQLEMRVSYIRWWTLDTARVVVKGRSTWPDPPVGACAANVLSPGTGYVAPGGTQTLAASLAGCPFASISNVVLKLALYQRYREDAVVTLIGPTGLQARPHGAVEALAAAIWNISYPGYYFRPVLAGEYELRSDQSSNVRFDSTPQDCRYGFCSPLFYWPVTERPTIRQPYQPAQNFSVFTGSSPAGTWRVVLRSVANSGDWAGTGSLPAGREGVVRGFQVLVW